MTSADVAEHRDEVRRLDRTRPVEGLGAWERLAPSMETGVAIGLSILVVSMVVGFFGVASYTDADTWVPIGVLFFLTLISLAICARLSGMPRDRRLFKILLVAFALKMLFTGPRYVLNEVYYGGEVDAARYDQAGDYFVQNAAEGKLSIEGSELNDFPKETRAVGYVTGGLYILFGTSYFGGYLVFSWLSWLGLVCFFKAFRIAFPNAPPYRAAILIFFLPSSLFWPSSLGKDAIMVFCLGMAALGVSRMVSSDRVVRGGLIAAVGLAAMMQIRPHLVLVTVVALAGCQIARSSRSSGGRAMAFRIVMYFLLIPLLLIGLTRMDALIGSVDGGITGIEENLDRTLSRTQTGNSAFEAQAVRSPLDLPASMITVIYRPFLFEATNVGVAIAAIEGSILIVLTVAAGRWIWRIGPAMAGSPFAAFCGVFVVGFVIAFSNIANAGILARQRAQMFPFLMAVACAAYEHHRLALQAPAAPAAGTSAMVARPGIRPGRPSSTYSDRSTS